MGKYPLCDVTEITQKEGIPMIPFELTRDEIIRRKKLSDTTRKMVCNLLDVVAEDDTSIMTVYRDFYHQISFSEVHPLMVFYMAKQLDHAAPIRDDLFNDMNQRSVLGSHSVNANIGCYNYRATHWLEAEISQTRFFEILDRCIDEAAREFLAITHYAERSD